MIIKKEFIPLFKGIDLANKRLPFLVAQTDKPGPIIWLTAAIHGDEVTGTAVIQSLFKRLEKFPLYKGTLYAFPILNIPGFETISHQDIYAGINLNRCFGGDEKGSTSEIQASLILNKILETKPNYIIDLHTDSRNSIAYAIVDYPTNLKTLKTFKESIYLAENLGFSWAIDTEKTAGYSPQKCLTGRLITEAVPAITLELGGPLVVMEEFRRFGLEAIGNFLNNLGMFSQKEPVLKKEVPKVIYTFSERIRTRSTGIIEYRVKPGEEIIKRQVLGKIRDVFGDTIEVIRSPIDGILFSHEDQSVTFPGQTLFTLAVKSDFNLFL